MCIGGAWNGSLKDMYMPVLHAIKCQQRNYRQSADPAFRINPCWDPNQHDRCKDKPLSAGSMLGTWVCRNCRDDQWRRLAVIREIANPTNLEAKATSSLTLVMTAGLLLSSSMPPFDILATPMKQPGPSRPVSFRAALADSTILVTQIAKRGEHFLL